MYLAPRGECGECLLLARRRLADQQIACGDHGDVGAGAESPLYEEMQAGEVGHHLQSSLRDEEVSAVKVAAAAGLRQISGTWGDDDDASVAACQDDALQVGHGRCQRDLVDDHYLADHVVDPVL